MTSDLSRIIPGGQPPARVAQTQQGDSEEAFHDLAKSEENVEDYKAQRAGQGKLTRTRQTGLQHPRIEERSNNNEKVGYSKFSERLRCCVDPLTGQQIWLYWVADA